MLPILRVLVADPSRTSCQQTANQFVGRPGVEVVQAHDGAAVVAALRDWDVQIAIIDRTTPGLDGDAVYQWCQDQGRRALLFICAAHLDERWPSISANVRAYDSLLKPIRRARADAILRSYHRLQVPCRALVVDGTLATTRVIVGLLRQSRFELTGIEEIDSGRHALRIAQIERFDIALVSMGLDDLPGAEVASRLSELPEPPRVVLIGNPDDRAAFGDASLDAFGAHAYLRKPFAAHELDAALHTAFGLWRPYLAKALGSLNGAAA